MKMRSLLRALVVEIAKGLGYVAIMRGHPWIA